MLYILIKYDGKINQFSSPVKHGIHINYKPVNLVPLRNTDEIDWL